MVEPTWERRPGEPAAAYRAFVKFRNLGPARTQRKVFEQLCMEKAMEGQPTSNGLPPAGIVIMEGDPPNPNQAQKKKIADAVQNYSSRWQWLVRCRDWDAFIDRQVQERNELNYDKLRDKQIKVVAAADAVNVLFMSELLRRVQTGEGRAALQGLDMKDLLKLAVDSASRVKNIQEAERRANGVIEKKASSSEAGPYTWIISEYQPPRPPDELIEAADEIMAHKPLSFPDEGDDPLIDR